MSTGNLAAVAIKAQGEQGGLPRGRPPATWRR